MTTPSLRPRPPSAARAGRRLAASVRAALLGLLLMLFLPVAAPAAEPQRAASTVTVEGTVPGWSADAAYSIWAVTNLDLTRADQPAAQASVTDGSGDFALTFDPAGRPFWVFLHQRFQPVGGPPIDLFLPYDLLPFRDAPEAAIEIPGVEPALLMRRERLSTRPEVLGKWLVLLGLVFGSGFGLRRLLRPFAGPEGKRSAPLQGLIEPTAPSSRERMALGAVLLATLALRMPRFNSASLDLLELSYLPGIGRPTDAGRGLVGMLRELAQLYCLDLVHPPLYHAVMGFMGVLGDAPWLLRFPGLLASLATGWLLWSLFRRWSPAAGIGAAAVFGLAAPAIYFGQDATPYSTVGLVAVASVTTLMTALRTGRNRDWHIWFAVIVGGFFCHYNVALMGLAEVGLLLVLAWMGRADMRWPAAVHRAMRPALLWAPLPMGWVWVHLSTFPTVAQDTRLVADTYAPDPGWVSFLWDFWTVLGGIPAARSPWPPAAVVALCLLGLWAALGRRGGSGERSANPASPPATQPGPTLAERAPGLLLLVLTLTFFASVAFFYVNVREYLAGKVFYGFRWVGWFHPVLLGVAVLGVVRGPAPAMVRTALALVWLAGLLPATWEQITLPSRPDYAGVARLMKAELEDRDALATLPAWFQRGNLSHYVMSLTSVGRLPEEGEGVWLIDGKRLTIEAIHPSLPFETTARNSHFERLWVAVVQEEMFGRAKFSPGVAEQAIAWADAWLIPDGIWQLDRIRLYRYRRPADALQFDPSRPLRLDSAETVMNHRTYPPVEGPRGVFVPPDQLTPRRAGLGRTVNFHAPMTPGCVDWTFAGLKASLTPDAPHHGLLELRVPLGAGAPIPEVVKTGDAQVHARREGDVLRVSAVGPPCDVAPLGLTLRSARPVSPPSPSPSSPTSPSPSPSSSPSSPTSPSPSPSSPPPTTP